ncbi:hypothetical protein Pedsa_3754 [Pseudopedobacter saltans DSM 12145]|uniref:Secretion system C-terminal sorting domain-containing protein n=1 Tax=Pseudopedobacter saltans (strain ATCC 51119 / DSM 12145 / JCM 21818 / CCUG 39354 / LMG 10337 / NBRC 100064 / NCIMB 13643) TaxID=762903 RepID=F0S6F7_PSESL|nr:T9SS type A sorting domain-containing protein [Pseudopedobacter saltans]ADY54283.1 hypothetical protein Pedsa_3754 [Pseudopedobacter saltans DSM 12145]
MHIFTKLNLTVALVVGLAFGVDAQTEKALNHDFRTGNLYSWQVDPGQSYSSLAINSSLNPVRMIIKQGQANNAENTNYRSDIRVTPLAGNALNPEITIYKQYPVVAIKWKRPVSRSVTFDDTSLGTVTSNPGITFDTDKGDYKRGSNNDTRLTVDDYTVSYWNMATGLLRANGSNNVYALTGHAATLPTGTDQFITDSIQLGRITIKVADIKMSATEKANGMNLIDVLWIKTFPSVEALQAYIEGGETLPVSLSNYKVQLQNNGNVAVNWTVESEYNNDYFTVERKQANGEFMRIAKIPSKGTGSLSYSIIDNNAAAGVNYYRLAQVDKDGTRIELGIQSVNVALSNESNLKVFPQPIIGSELIFTYNSKLPTLEVQLLDVTGKKVLRDNITALEGNNYTVKLKNNLAAGVYVLLVNNQQHKVVIK